MGEWIETSEVGYIFNPSPREAEKKLKWEAQTLSSDQSHLSTKSTAGSKHWISNYTTRLEQQQDLTCLMFSYASCACSAHGGQKRALSHLKPELHMAVVTL